MKLDKFQLPQTINDINDGSYDYQLFESCAKCRYQ